MTKINGFGFIFFLVAWFFSAFSFAAKGSSTSKKMDNWFESARRGDLESLKKLSATIPLDSVNLAGESALILSAEGGFSSAVDFLISKHANLNLQDKAGNTALVYSVLGGFDELSLLLIEKGADASLASVKNTNALFVAAKSGRVKLVEALVKTNSSLLNQTNADGETPIFTAVREAHFALAEKMITLGSKIDIRNHGNQTLLDVAKSSGVPEGHTLLKKLSQNKTN